MSFHFMIVSHLLLILLFISLCLKPEMWQKVAKFKGAEYFRKALYMIPILALSCWQFEKPEKKVYTADLLAH